jgi:DNA-binding NtrC family response regulator
MDRSLMSISPAAMTALENYAWPGNVRELENLIERTVALTDNEIIEPQDLPPYIGEASDADPALASAPRITESGVNMPKIIGNIERTMIQQALELSNGVKARAANLLSINRTTLVEKIKRLKIDA